MKIILTYIKNIFYNKLSQMSLLILLINLLITDALFYSQYKRYFFDKFPQDAKTYLQIVYNLFNNNTIEPFKYRISTPLIVNKLDLFRFLQSKSVRI